MEQDEDSMAAANSAAQGGLIKLFVGQIPKTWEEEDIREILEPHGAIRELTILKDKISGTHKGCAFVTFNTRNAAVEAQKNLHEKKTLPGMNHPMQVKPATNEPRNTTVGREERRLFVGMLSRDLSEDDVRLMFAQFGPVEDVSILRNAQGTSKGAAFVRMAAKTQALQAITALHQSQTMAGCSAPLVVKIADTDKEKAQRRLQQAMTSLGNQFGGLNNLTAFGLGMNTAAYYQQALLQLQQATHGAPTASNSFGLGTADLQALAALNQQSQINQAAAAAGPPGMGNLGSAVLSATAGQHKLGLGNDALMQAYVGMQTPTVALAAGTPVPLVPYLASASSLAGYTTPTLPSPQSTTPGFPVGAAHNYLYQKQRDATVHQKQREGPEGCNLFIYHLPNDVQDMDLVQMFQPFGSVISSKVFIDKHTNLSKCFGFVSYDNPLSAQSAIQAMNGFQIGTKRLKVQLKRPKDASKPY
jgi:CUG-BP- and ETR3-like factor